MKKATPKRPNSANSSKRTLSAGGAGASSGRIGKLKHAIAMAKAEEEELMTTLSREDLLLALHDSKKQIASLESTIERLHADNIRWQGDFSRQQKRIDTLLTSVGGDADGEVRKEIEKTMIVRQLKQHIQTLRSGILERDGTIESLKKSQKASRIMELSAEKEEYYFENVRLKRMIDDKRGGSAKNGSAAANKRDLSSEYQHILEGMLQGVSAAEAARKDAKAVNGVSGNGSPHAGTGKKKRPSSATAALSKGKKKGSIKGKRDFSVERESMNILSKAEGNNIHDKMHGYLKSKDADGAEREEPWRESREELSVPSIVRMSSQKSESMQGNGAGSSSSKGKEEDAPRLTKNDRWAADASSENIQGLKSESPSSQSLDISNSKYQIGDRIKGLFRGGTAWYAGKVQGVSFGRAPKSTPKSKLVHLYHIIYDDGDEERNMVEETVRGIDEPVPDPVMQTHPWEADEDDTPGIIETLDDLQRRADIIDVGGMVDEFGNMVDPQGKFLNETQQRLLIARINDKIDDMKKSPQPTKSPEPEPDDDDVADVQPLVEVVPRFKEGQQVEVTFPGQGSVEAVIRKVWNDGLKVKYDLQCNDGDTAEGIPETSIRVLIPPKPQSEQEPVPEPVPEPEMESKREMVAITGSDKVLEPHSENNSIPVVPDVKAEPSMHEKHKESQREYDKDQVDTRYDGDFEDVAEEGEGMDDGSKPIRVVEEVARNERRTSQSSLQSGTSAKSAGKIPSTASSVTLPGGVSDGTAGVPIVVPSPSDSCSQQTQQTESAKSSVKSGKATKEAPPVTITYDVEYTIGDEVEARYKGGSEWYEAVVKKANADASGNADGTYHLEYDDGDEERSVPASLMRPIATKDPTKDEGPSSNSHSNDVSATQNPGNGDPSSILDTLPKHTEQGEKVQTVSSGSRRGSAISSASKPIPAYALEQKVEALFDGYEGWWLATIKAVHIQESLCVYDLVYDDGDAADGVAEANIRVLPFSSSASEAIGTDAGETPTAVQEERASVHTTVDSKQARFKLREKVEALFDGYDGWWGATVTHVREGHDMWMYDLLYDDGDSAEGVEESKIRPTGTSEDPNGAGVPQMDTEMQPPVDDAAGYDEDFGGEAVSEPVSEPEARGTTHDGNPNGSGSRTGSGADALDDYLDNMSDDEDDQVLAASVPKADAVAAVDIPTNLNDDDGDDDGDPDAAYDDDFD